MKKTPLKKVKAGDVLRMPLSKDVFVFAKILYSSRRYLGVMLLGLARGLHSSSLPPNLDFTAGLFYTAVTCPAYNGWEVVGQVPPSVSETACALRIVAGNVWLGDTHTRPATDKDYASLPQMDVLGCALLQKKIHEFYNHAIPMFD